MINPKDVIRLLMPYPNMTSKLAIKRHMYVCISNDGRQIILAKSQTDTPSARAAMTQYVFEFADLTRNPYVHETLIDCDKFFVLTDCNIPDGLKTTRRTDVCQELYNDIISKNPHVFYEYISKTDLCALNPTIT